MGAKKRSPYHYVSSHCQLCFWINTALLHSVRILARCIARNADAHAKKLIVRIQSLVVAPPASDAKTFKINGTVLNPEFKPARGIVGCLSVQEGSDAVFLGRAETNIRGQFSLDIATEVKPNSGAQLIGVGFNHRLGWTVRFTEQLASKRSLSIVLRETTGDRSRDRVAIDAQRKVAWDHWSRAFF